MLVSYLRDQLVRSVARVCLEVLLLHCGHGDQVTLTLTRLDTQAEIVSQIYKDLSF